MSKLISSKLYFLNLLIISLVIGVITFTYFYMQPKVYKSSGKFSISYQDPEGMAAKNLYNSNLSSMALALTESIKSRVFVDQLLTGASVEFESEELNKTNKIISATVLKDSSIVSVDIFNKDREALERINKLFLESLNNSEAVKSQEPEIIIKAIDPLYAGKSPVYPAPVKFTIFAIAGTFLLGLMVIYTFAEDKEDESYIVNYKI